jgi:hemolysin activation/secretion protein
MRLFSSPLATALLFSFSALAQNQPQVTIGHVAIVDTPGISEHELNQIAKQVEGKSCTTTDAADCIGERVRDQFQQRGYFKAIVQEPRLKPFTNSGKVDANVVVIPGMQYMLGDMEFQFTGVPSLSKTELAPLITAHSGMLFDIARVRRTLENLRAYYQSRGYANVAIVPTTQVNDEKREVFLTLDIQPAS